MKPLRSLLYLREGKAERECVSCGGAQNGGVIPPLKYTPLLLPCLLILSFPGQAGGGPGL